MIRRLAFSLLTVLLVSVMAACSSSDGSDDGSITLQLGHELPENTPASDAIEEMAESVAEKTDGRVTFEVFPNDQLGNASELLEQMNLGTTDAAGLMVGSMQTLDKRLAIEDLPYMFKDKEHARAAYKGEFGDAIADIVAEEGLTVFGLLEWGFRHITNNKNPIVEPEDMEGLNIRVAEAELRVDAFEEIGAIPTVVAFSELYGGLQQGVVDAQENPLSSIVSSKFYEVQDYLSLTGHFYNTVVLSVVTEEWDKISEEDQDIILKETERIQAKVEQKNDENEEGYLQELKENGMEINDNVNKEAFREKASSVYDKWEAEVFGEELMDVYREASGW